MTSTNEGQGLAAAAGGLTEATILPLAEPAAQHDLLVLAILSTLLAFASISTDLYLPAMPAMGRALHAGTGAIAFTVSGYLIGFSVGQLVWGPISDRYGRRLPIAIGLVLFVIGAAGCALSVNAGEMIFWRVVQALGACAGVVLARAMVRDLYEGNRAAQMLSTLMTVMGIAPLLGPLIGGQILLLASWRAIFWVLVVVGLATLAAMLLLPETLPPARRNHEPLGHAAARYLSLLRQRRVIGYIGAGAFFFGGAFAGIAGTPFAYIGYYHVVPQLYGLLFGAGIIGMMATNVLNARLVVRFGTVALLRVGTSVAMVAAVMLAADAHFGWGGLAGLVLPLVLFMGCNGLIVANSIAGALAAFPERAGAVSALAGALQYGTGIVGSAMVGAFADGTPWPMGWVIATSGVGGALCAWLIVPTPTKLAVALAPKCDAG